MTSPPNSHNPKRLNVLALDGGGIRGVSSLLILRDLMSKINSQIEHATPAGETLQHVEPHHIFELVAGTSTGGLIAIMLGKLNMSLDDCIAAYHDVSKTIFGYTHKRGKLTCGLALDRYSGSKLRSCVAKLVRDKHGNSDLLMKSHGDADRIACSVVCREQGSSSRYSDFKRKPVCLCSCHPCPERLSTKCLVCDAARATSAAPTYFPVHEIHGRYFVDGGMEYNNPSHAIFDHYSEKIARRLSGNSELLVSNVPQDHQGLNFCRVRFVNLGTGTKTDSLRPNEDSVWAQFIPGAFRMLAFLKRSLTEFATNSEGIAGQMRALARVSEGGVQDIRYERFSADNGVCFIKMDKYKKLDEITKLTEQYLERGDIQTQLEMLSKELALEYLEFQRSATHLAVPASDIQRSQISERTSADSHHMPRLVVVPEASTGSGTRDTSATTSLESSNGGIEVSTNTMTSEPISAIPPRQSRDVEILGPVVDASRSRTPSITVTA